MDIMHLVGISFISGTFFACGMLAILVTDKLISGAMVAMLGLLIYGWCGWSAINLWWKLEQEEKKKTE